MFRGLSGGITKPIFDFFFLGQTTPVKVPPVLKNGEKTTNLFMFVELASTCKPVLSVYISFTVYSLLKSAYSSVFCVVMFRILFLLSQLLWAEAGQSEPHDELFLKLFSLFQVFLSTFHVLMEAYKTLPLQGHVRKLHFAKIVGLIEHGAT
jgi:hypothetical protein